MNNKTIAVNTAMLYFRMMFTMIVTLFTSRVILRVLGIDDFGIYQTVGGIVAMLSFLNNALATGSSRFLTFELGTGNYEKLKKTFSTVLSVHILLAFIIVILAETVGLWFVFNKINIESDRMDAAIFTYHMSIVAVVFTITQVPYNASIISHEKMSIYAYTSIVEVLLKLGIVYLIYLSPYDKLKTYALLYTIVSISMACYYRIYCRKNFDETYFKLSINKQIMKEVMGYSGWNLFANTSIALNNHGSTVLVNMFFNPAIVTARSVANQVNMAAYSFISNFRIAVNPQIVKRYAANDFEGSKKLLLESTKYSFYLMLILAVPICLNAKTILSLWLGVVPEYSEIFLQLAVLTSLFQVFDSSFYTALYAKGRIRENAMISPMLGFCIFPIAYILFKFGASPIALAYALMILYAILGLIVKPILIVKIVGYRWREIILIFAKCGLVTIVGSIVPILFYIYQHLLDGHQIVYMISSSLSSVFFIGIVIWCIGIDKELRTKIIQLIKKQLKNENRNTNSAI